MKTLAQLRQECIDLIHSKVDEFNANHLDTTLSVIKLPYPLVEFSNRMKRTAGTAYTRENRIVLSNDILQCNPEAFLADTPIHELCHIIADRYYNSRGHDSKFYATCRLMGCKDSRCHNMETEHVKYTCQNCGKLVKLSMKRHTKMRKGKTTYGCGVCSGPIRAGKDAPKEPKVIVINM